MLVNSKLKLIIITPTGIPFEDFIESILIKTENGELSLCKNYAPTIGIIKKNKIKIKYNSKNLEYLVSDGVYVISDNTLKVITNYFYENTKENLDIINKKSEVNIDQHNDESSKEISLVKLIQQLKRK